MTQTEQHAAEATTRTHRLADWRPYPYRLLGTELRFVLDPHATRVFSSLEFEATEGGDLVLDGGGLRTLALAVNGRPLPLDLLPAPDEPLVIPAAMLPDGSFTFAAEVEIDPASNTTLEGL